MVEARNAGDEWKGMASALGLPVSDRSPDDPVFLRVGRWNPAYPRSRNFAGGDTEIGLSVHELDSEGTPVVPPEGEWAETDMAARIASQDPKFLVQGQVLGWDHDGEPLLGSPVVVGLATPATDPSPPSRSF